MTERADRKEPAELQGERKARRVKAQKTPRDHFFL